MSVNTGGLARALFSTTETLSEERSINSKGSITLLRDEIEALRAASPTGRLQDLAPFNIMVSFIPVGGSLMANHNIKGCQFLNDGVEAKEGDTKMEKVLDLVVGSIDWRA